MSQDTPVSAKDNIDRAQVFAVYNVYRLVIGSVLFALTLSASESPLFTNDTSVQLLVSGIFIVTSLIIATFGTASKLTSESAIFGVMPAPEPKKLPSSIAFNPSADPYSVIADAFWLVSLIQHRIQTHPSEWADVDRCALDERCVTGQ